MKVRILHRQPNLSLVTQYYRSMDDLIEQLRDDYPGTVTFPGLEDAIVGIAGQWSKRPLVVYDYEKLIECFMRQNSWTYDEAQEWVDFNVTQVWAGDGTPLIMHSIDTIDT